MFKWFFKTGKGTSRAPAERLPSPAPGPEAKTRVNDESQIIENALKHHQAGHLSEAEAAYRHVLEINPAHVDALHLSGLIAFKCGNYLKAVELISRALSLNPSFSAAQNNLGNVFRAQGRIDEAIGCFRRALSLNSDYVDAHISLSVLLKSQGKFDEALVSAEKAVALSPGHAPAYLNLGELHQAQGKRREAAECYRQALALAPDSFQAQCNCGDLLGGIGDLGGAALCYRNALKLKPDAAVVHINLGNVLLEQGLPDEAIACYEQAIILDPDIPEAHLNLGNVFKEHGKLDQALACYHSAIALKSDFHEARYGMGAVLKDQGRLDEAIAHYRETLALKPDYPEAHYALGSALKELHRMEEAFDCYRRALLLRPDYGKARWALVMSRIPAVYETNDESVRCRDDYSRELDGLDRWFDADHLAGGIEAVGTQQPFFLAYQEQDNRELMQRYGALCTRIMADWFGRQNFSRIGGRGTGGLIRIGVVSQYFNNHSVWNAITKGWFQNIDRKRFSLHAFYVGSRQDQEMILAKSAANYFEYGQRSLHQWVRTIIGQQPDVLIYPEIGMDTTTLRLASLRLAPVQIATWGHPETTGLQTIDYYLSAELLEPGNAQKNYTEKLVALPNLGCYYQPFTVKSAEPDLGGLVPDPETPLLLCPGVPFKYAPAYDWIFVEIARRLGRCKLIFFTYKLNKISEKLRHRLEAAFVGGGLDFEQFVAFIPWQNSAQFFGLLKRADVYLDTIGFSGFNTAIQAAECGLPIVTREGRFMRGRLASGILKRMGLAELVVETEEDYIVLAVRLAQDAAYRSHIRERIEASRQILFEDTAPIRALEEFLTRVSVQC